MEISKIKIKDAGSGNILIKAKALETLVGDLLVCKIREATEIDNCRKFRSNDKVKKLLGDAAEIAEKDHLTLEKLYTQLRNL